MYYSSFPFIIPSFHLLFPISFYYSLCPSITPYFHLLSLISIYYSLFPFIIPHFHLSPLLSSCLTAAPGSTEGKCAKPSSRTRDGDQQSGAPEEDGPQAPADPLGDSSHPVPGLSEEGTMSPQPGEPGSAHSSAGSGARDRRSLSRAGLAASP